MIKKVTPNPDSLQNDSNPGSKHSSGLFEPPGKVVKQLSRKDVMSTTAPSIVLKLYKRLDDKTWTIYITCVTIYALFGDDVRLAVCPPSYDATFQALSIVAFISFTYELVISFWASIGYRFSFYNILDFIATITMVPDIPIWWNPIVELFSSDSATDASWADGFQASRVGTRSTKLVKVVRMVRLVRMVKLWKYNKKAEEDEEGEEPSLVGRKLSEMTMRRVISIVLTMLVVLPFFDDLSGVSKLERWHGLETLHRMPQDYNVSVEQFTHHIQEYVRNTGQMLFLEICSYVPEEHDPHPIIDYTMCFRYNLVPGGPNNESHPTRNSWSPEAIEDIARETVYSTGSTNHPDYSDYYPVLINQHTRAEIESMHRIDSELDIIEITGCYWANHTQIDSSIRACRSVAYFKEEASSRWQAVMNILRTLFVMLVLAMGSYLFTHDAEILVIRPIGRMVAIVKQLAEDPMMHMKPKEPESNAAPHGYETVLLERTIAKIGKLLQIGFGEAGALIITKNMDANSGLDPMVNGKKMNGAFGFCDIRNFTDTTECLQEKVMIYVNKVGKIVHEATHDYYGAANKNIGDAFLLVWKIDDSRGGASPSTRSPTNRNPDVFHINHAQPNYICDFALVAFLKIIVDLKRENGPGGCLHKYKHNKVIRERFGDDFEIRMGMGLHVGWAIEGAIGSEYKIDASYLSPNVNMASRLEAATKQFRTPLLLSEDFFANLSPSGRTKCRLIDRVTVKGSVHPMGLYTVDVVNYPERFMERDRSQPPPTTFDFDSDEFLQLQSDIPAGFLGSFRKGVDNYLNGNWQAAKQDLDKCCSLKENDGPSVSLLLVMEKHNFTAPETWPGYRELTEK